MTQHVLVRWGDCLAGKLPAGVEVDAPGLRELLRTECGVESPQRNSAYPDDLGLVHDSSGYVVLRHRVHGRRTHGNTCLMPCSITLIPFVTKPISVVCGGVAFPRLRSSNLDVPTPVKRRIAQR